MTTDTTALQESIARALAPSHPHPLKPEACNGCRRLRDNAAAVLPIIREAQAEALRGAAGSMNDDLDYSYLIERARQYEQGADR